MLVLPLASVVVKQLVFLPFGRLLMNGEMLHEVTARPSSEANGIVRSLLTTKFSPEVGV